jgi:glucarate dehydratase
MPRIEHVTVTPVAFKDPPLLNAQGVHQPWCLRSIIEVTVEGGVVGLGETYGDELILHYLNAAAKRLTGVEVWSLNAIRKRVEEAVAAVYQPGSEHSPRTARNTLVPRVFAAFEVAALDAMGKLSGQRVCELLGGQVREAVPFSAYLFYKFERHRFADYEPDDPWGEALTPEGVVRQAQRMVELHGFTSLKLKGGVLEPEAEVEAIKALRAAFPDLPLRLDPNALWHVHTALKLLPKLEGLLEYLEDPTQGIPAMAVVQKATSMPLATNMCVVSFPELPPAIAQGAVKVILSDHHFWGGLVASRDLGRICDTWGLGLSMHSNSHLGISLMAMSHLAAATPNLTYACDTHYPWEQDDVIAGGKIPIRDGCVRLPDGPGLGIELDRDALARMHADYLACGIRKRDDASEIKKYSPDWSPARPRF